MKRQHPPGRRNRAGYGQSDFQSSLGAAAAMRKNKAGECSFDATGDVAAQAKDRIVGQAKEQMQGWNQGGADYLTDSQARSIAWPASSTEHSSQVPDAHSFPADGRCRKPSTAIPQRTGAAGAGFRASSTDALLRPRHGRRFRSRAHVQAAGPSSESSDAPAQRA